jgi:hypothetical protein
MENLDKNKIEQIVKTRKQAHDNGTSDGEIIEAIEVAIDISGGSGTTSARFAMNVLEYYKAL